MTDRTATRDELIAHYRRMLAEHDLVPLLESGPVLAWQLRRPGTRACLVELLFTAEGILIHGDLKPRGSAGPCGAARGLRWFVAGMGPGYLASYFLQRRWTPESAEAHIRDNIATLREGVDYTTPDRDEALERCSRLEQMVKDGEGLSGELDYQTVWIPEWEEDGSDFEWDYPPSAYDLSEFATLAAIHERFRELFRQRFESVAADADGQPVLVRRAEQVAADGAGGAA